jgi:hypothetical protein
MAKVTEEGPMCVCIRASPHHWNQAVGNPWSAKSSLKCKWPRHKGFTIITGVRLKEVRGEDDYVLFEVLESWKKAQPPPIIRRRQPQATAPETRLGFVPGAEEQRAVTPSTDTLPPVKDEPPPSPLPWQTTSSESWPPTEPTPLPEVPRAPASDLPGSTPLPEDPPAASSGIAGYDEGPVGGNAGYDGDEDDELFVPSSELLDEAHRCVLEYTLANKTTFNPYQCFVQLKRIKEQDPAFQWLMLKNFKR